MEFVDRAAGINSAFGNGSRRKMSRARRKVGKAFLHTVISHLFVYQEFHGDLHPGNILVANSDELYLIDWGNTVDISTIWKPALKYLQAVLAGDTDAIIAAIVELGTDRKQMEACRKELSRHVQQILTESGVEPLGYNFLLTLYNEGQEGLTRRLELAINLATALSRQGIVVRSDYMHLTRSLTAMVGSYLSIYRGLSRLVLVQDIVQVLVQFPAIEGMRQLSGYRRSLLAQLPLIRSRKAIREIAIAETGIVPKS